MIAPAMPIPVASPVQEAGALLTFQLGDHPRYSVRRRTAAGFAAVGIAAHGTNAFRIWEP
jgi:hypothetical protein